MSMVNLELLMCQYFLSSFRMKEEHKTFQGFDSNLSLAAPFSQSIKFEWRAIFARFFILNFATERIIFRLGSKAGYFPAIKRVSQRNRRDLRTQANVGFSSS